MSRPKSDSNASVGSPLFGLTAAASFSVSAVLIRSGLNTGVPSVVGLWIGFAMAWLTYLPVYLTGRVAGRWDRHSQRIYYLQILAGLAITLGMWARYLAIRTVPIGVVTALGRVNIPLILLLSPLFFRSKLDATSLRLWIGSLLIVAGTAVIVFLG